MLLYYITERSQFHGDQNIRLLATIAQAARCGVDYVQLREKDLSTHQLEMLARAAIRGLRTGNPQLKTALLINSRTDVALACGAQGVHLRSDDISPAAAREIWAERAVDDPARVTVSISCHTRAEVARAAEQGADFAIFGPVFEKEGTRPRGVDELREACQEKIPVLALGGITVENAEACLQAGAAGIAAIRLFQENEMGRTVAALRALEPVDGVKRQPRNSQG